MSNIDSQFIFLVFVGIYSFFRYIYIDDTLSWNVQCDKFCANVAGKISVLRRIRPLCRPNTLKLLYEKTIQPVFEYACSVWCHTKQGDISKLQHAQNYAAKIVTGNFDYVNFRSVELLHELNWASVKDAITLQQ